MNEIISSVIVPLAIVDSGMSKKDLAVIILKSIGWTALICIACIFLDILCH